MYYYLGSSLGFFLHWIYQLNEVFEQFTNLMIDENEFQNLCRRVSLTKSDFMRMQTDEYIGSVLEPKAIAYIEAKGLALS